MWGKGGSERLSDSTLGLLTPNSILFLCHLPPHLLLCSSSENLLFAAVFLSYSSVLSTPWRSAWRRMLSPAVEAVLWGADVQFYFPGSFQATWTGSSLSAQGAHADYRHLKIPTEADSCSSCSHNFSVLNLLWDLLPVPPEAWSCLFRNNCLPLCFEASVLSVEAGTFHALGV